MQTNKPEEEIQVLTDRVFYPIISVITIILGIEIIIAFIKFS